jgi:hypothetical protein
MVAAGLGQAHIRRTTAWIFAIGGLLAYNWWVLVPLKPGLMRSPNEYFSNLEVTGLPYAADMQHLDIAAGVMLLIAFLVLGGRSLPGASREWLCMVVFAMAGAIGGLFPQVCEDGINPRCMAAEWHFQLPLTQYVHDGSGVVEFTAITLAAMLAVRRTWRDHGVLGRTYRAVALTGAIAYPVLGGTYLFNKLGGVVEAVFFVAFAVMVLIQVAERVPRPRLAPACADGMMGDNESDLEVVPPWQGADGSRASS